MEETISSDPSLPPAAKWCFAGTFVDLCRKLVVEGIADDILRSALWMALALPKGPHGRR